MRPDNTPQLPPHTRTTKWKAEYFVVGASGCGRAVSLPLLPANCFTWRPLLLLLWAIKLCSMCRAHVIYLKCINSNSSRNSSPRSHFGPSCATQLACPHFAPARPYGCSAECSAQGPCSVRVAVDATAGEPLPPTCQEPRAGRLRRLRSCATAGVSRTQSQASMASGDPEGHAQRDRDDRKSRRAN